VNGTEHLSIHQIQSCIGYGCHFLMQPNMLEFTHYHVTMSCIWFCSVYSHFVYLIIEVDHYGCFKEKNIKAK